MKKALLSLLLSLVAVCAGAQTTYNLPSTTVSYIVYTYPYTYANLFASDIPVTINGMPYYLNLDAHTDANGNCVAPYCNITFQNLETGEEMSVAYVGSFSPLPAYGKPTTLTGTFSGAFSGSFVLNIVPKLPKPPCGRYGCRLYYVQQGSTLTLQ